MYVLGTDCVVILLLPVLNLDTFHVNITTDSIFIVSVHNILLTVNTIRTKKKNRISIQYIKLRSLILMQFVCIVGFDWLVFYIKFSI